MSLQPGPDDEGHEVKRVVRGRQFLGNSEPDRMVSLLEPPSAVEPFVSRGPDNTKRAGEWDILIQGWARDEDGWEDCDMAYILAHDVHRAIAKAKHDGRATPRNAANLLGFGSAVREMKIGTPVVRPSEEVTGYGVFYTILTLTIVEDTATRLG